MINNEKNLVSDIRTHVAEPGAYFWYFYLTLLRASKYMVAEMERCEGYLDKRRALMEERQIEDAKKEEESKNKTEDSREMENENNTDMVFSRKGDMDWLNDEAELRSKV